MNRGVHPQVRQSWFLWAGTIALFYFLASFQAVSQVKNAAQTSDFGSTLRRAQTAKLPADIRSLSSGASVLSRFVLGFNPPTGLRSWAIAGLVRHAYGVQAFEADLIEEDDPEAARQLRAEAVSALRLAREAGWQRLETMALHQAPKADEDVGLVFWTAAAWGALLGLDRNDLDLLADWPKAKALAMWVLRHQPDYGDGAALVLGASFELTSPGGDKALARQWLQSVLERHGSKQAMLHVMVAEQLDLEAGNRDAFVSRLQLALQVADAHPGFENRLAATKAGWLLSRIDSLF
ncbi:MAG: hypothetical protein EBX69_11370 [Betaproteobacteria bacterium]|nr:hypothetical protein [Betaproteobacteria bacterium]